MLANTFLISFSTLMIDGRPAPGSREFFAALVRERIPFAILTNQSQRTLQELTDYLEGQGFRGIMPSMFYTTVMAAADEILQMYPKKRMAGYLGGRGMREILRLAGFSVDLDRADWLFVGMSPEISDMEYSYALRLIEQGAVIVETDARRLVRRKKEPYPGAGSIVRMLEYAASTQAMHADMPDTMLIRHAMQYLNALSEQTVLITSDLDREVRSANTFGIRSIFVTAGMDDSFDMMEHDVHPTYVIETLEGLLRR
ncbi:MAG: HAD hydrolase-like protein [Solobacterium sp.]|nr:HAD hydrolase-like protein [Solobacterium sp.]